MALLDNQGGVAWWGGSSGYLEEDSQYPDFALPLPPKYLFSTTNAVGIVLGLDCDYTPWSDWSACDVT